MSVTLHLRLRAPVLYSTEKSPEPGGLSSRLQAVFWGEAAGTGGRPRAPYCPVPSRLPDCGAWAPRLREYVASAQAI